MSGSKLSEETRKRLGDQLIKLGDMMGDGMHLESDGKWIEKEYKKVAQALGYIPKTKRKRTKASVEEINNHMIRRCSGVKCRCGGEFEQTRSGSMTAKCTTCTGKATLLKKIKKRG